MSISVEVLTDPEIKRIAQEHGRWTGEIGDSHAHVTEEGDDTSGHGLDIVFRTGKPKEDEMGSDTNFKSLMDSAFPEGAPDNPDFSLGTTQES